MSDQAIVRIRLPQQLPEPLSHYTDAVRAGDHIWISGMLGVDAAGALSDAGVVSQAEQVFRNLRAVLDHEGAGFDDVVKVIVYLLDIRDRGPVNEVRRRHFGPARPVSHAARWTSDTLRWVDLEQKVDGVLREHLLCVHGN